MAIILITSFLGIMGSTMILVTQMSKPQARPNFGRQGKVGYAKYDRS